MKHLLLSFVAMLAVSLTVSAKSAIVVAHYGSSDDETRAKTLNLITEDIRRAFPDYEVREAYISTVVRNILSRRGIDYDSPVDALIKLRAEGYDSVYVQSTTVIDGIETADVRHSVERMAPFFKFAVTGRPLLYSPDDCMEVCHILLKEDSCGDHEAVVYVGHGNLQPGTATYCQIDYILGVSPEAIGTYHASTIEGYPTAQSTVVQLARDKRLKNVKLVPLLLVCGNHTKKDIAGQYAETIRNAGYDVEVVMRGMGEIPAIRDMYVTRVRELIGRGQ